MASLVNGNTLKDLTIQKWGSPAFGTKPGEFYNSKIRSLRGLEDVTAVGAEAFMNESYNGNQNIQKIELCGSEITLKSRSFQNCSSLESITLPNSETTIVEDCAFEGCSGLTSIEFSESITSLGAYAFQGCSRLENIKLPEGIERIRNNTFNGCSSFTNITLPENITSIENAAFENCSSLTSIELPGNITSIGTWVFKNCSKLTSITLPEGITSIGGETFYGCSKLKSIKLPNSITSIGSEKTFYSCSSLTSITLPSTTTIGNYAFDGVNSVETLDVVSFGGIDGILNGLVSSRLGTGALTNLNVIIKPKNDDLAARIRGIVGLAKEANAILKKDNVIHTIDISESGLTDEAVVAILSETPFSAELNWQIKLSDGSLIFILGENGAPAEMLACASNIKHLFMLPNSEITSIGKRAFYGCSKLTSITLPEGITSIGEKAFEGCSSLTSITLPEGIESIGDAAVAECSGLTSITLPGSIKSIEDYAVRNCSKLTSIILPEGITSIGKQAFEYCNLQNIVIPSTTTIGSGVFGSVNSSVETLDIISFGEIGSVLNNLVSTGRLKTETLTNLNVIVKPNDDDLAARLRGIVGLAKEANAILKKDNVIHTIDISQSGLTDDEVLAALSDSPFSAELNWQIKLSDGSLIFILGENGAPAEMLACASNIKHLFMLPNSEITSIGKRAFYGCSKLTSITLPEGITSIGEKAFEGCSSLTSITLPEGIENIGYAAVAECSGLTSITLPGSIKSIEDFAFDGCSGLTSITLPSTTTIGNYAFDGVNSVETLDVVSFGGIDGILNSLVSSWFGTEALTNLNVIIKPAPLSDDQATPDKEELATRIRGIVGLSSSILGKSSLTCTIDISESGLTDEEVVAILSETPFSADLNWQIKLSDGSLIFIVGKDGNPDDVGPCAGDIKHLFIFDKFAALLHHDYLTALESLSVYGSRPDGTGLNDDEREGVASLMNSNTLKDLTIQKWGSPTFGTADEFCNSAIHSLRGFEDVSIVAGAAFANNQNIETLELCGNEITFVNEAFGYCSQLQNIMLPNSETTNISCDTFASCSQLKSIMLPKSETTNIGGQAFLSCINLQSITLPESTTTSIGTDTFAGCSKLTNITLPSTTTISDNAFSDVNSVETLDIVSFGEIGSVLNSLVSNGPLETGKLTNLNVIVKPAPTPDDIVARVKDILTSSGAIVSKSGITRTIDISQSGLTDDEVLAALSASPFSADLNWQIKLSDGSLIFILGENGDIAEVTTNANNIKHLFVCNRAYSEDLAECIRKIVEETGLSEGGSAGRCAADVMEDAPTLLQTPARRTADDICSIHFSSAISDDKIISIFSATPFIAKLNWQVKLAGANSLLFIIGKDGNPDAVTARANNIKHLFMCDNFAALEPCKNMAKLQSLSLYGRALTPEERTDMKAIMDSGTPKDFTIQKWGIATLGTASEFYNSKIRSLRGFEDVTAVGAEAFYNSSGGGNTNIEKLEFWGNKITIKSKAFYTCSNLTNIALPNSETTNIAGYAFYHCNLQNICLPKSITANIGSIAFGNRLPRFEEIPQGNVLQSIVLPSTTTIASSAFNLINKVETLGIISFGEIKSVLNSLVSASLGTEALTHLNVIVKPAPTPDDIVARIRGILQLSSGTIASKSGMTRTLDLRQSGLSSDDCLADINNGTWSSSYTWNIILPDGSVTHVYSQ